MNKIEDEKGLYTIISARNLVKIYKKRRVVDNVTIHIERGEVVGLLGPNGAGKTTTFYMVVGLVTPNDGSVYLNDRNITLMPMYRRARLGIGYLAQENSVFRQMTVEDNIMSILEIFERDVSVRINRLEGLLEDLEIKHIRYNMAYSLSGGERRRTEIARALACHPNFLLLDEPFAGVDPLAVEDIQEIIRKLRDENNIGILITDHNARETLRITDRSYILADGRIRFQGSAEELAESPEARRLYLGDKFSL